MSLWAKPGVRCSSNKFWKKVQDKGLGAPCREKPLEKSGLEPAAPNRLADRKHCALSTHPDGDLDESIKRSASDRLGDLVPQVRARISPGVFRDMALLGLCLELSFSVLYCRTQANLPTLSNKFNCQHQALALKHTEVDPLRIAPWSPFSPFSGLRDHSIWVFT